MNSALDENDRIELKKHINAIHCSNNLTLVQRKIFNALLFNAYPTLPHKEQFEISAKNLCSLIRYNSNDYGKLKKALLGLITTAIEWNVINSATGEEDKWKASSILSAAELSNGICKYEYSIAIKELLYQPEIYGKININIMSQFKSSYALALYENCVRYQNLPQTPWLSIDIFRKLMGVFGTKYNAFKDFKKRVINIAVNEVNRLTQINITPEIERQNQKVTKIRFLLNKKQEQSVTREYFDNSDNDINAMLTTIFGLSSKVITQLISKYDEDYIREKITFIMNSDSYKEGRIRGLSGYLIEFLRKDYKANKSSLSLINEQRDKKELEKKANTEKEKLQHNRYEKYVNDKITNYTKSLSEDEYEILLAAFKETLKMGNELIYSWYAKQGIKHPAIKASFNKYIITEKKDQIGAILSFDDFTSLVDQYS